MGFSTHENSRLGFGPFAPGFKIIPFGDADALETTITPNTVGFLVEPIQEEAGVMIPPLGYLGSRVMLTVGKKITQLTPSRGFCAELAAASTVSDALKAAVRGVVEEDNVSDWKKDKLKWGIY